MFDVFPLFAAALRPQFLRTVVYPRGQKSVRLFYIQSNVIPILPILTYISTWIEITSSVSDVVSAVRVGGAREESCCLGAGEILRLLFSPNTIDKKMYTV